MRLKDDLANSLVRVAHKLQISTRFLTDLITAEVMELEDVSLTFRGNSLATKAIESYMKLVGETYLKNTLSDCVRYIIDVGAELEIDPSKVIFIQVFLWVAHIIFQNRTRKFAQMVYLARFFNLWSICLFKFDIVKYIVKLATNRPQVNKSSFWKKFFFTRWKKWYDGQSRARVRKFFFSFFLLHKNFFYEFVHF